MITLKNTWKKHELYKRLWRIWETFCDVAGHQWHQTGWRRRGQVSQTVAPGHHDLMIFKHYWHKNKSKTYQIYIMRRTRQHWRCRQTRRPPWQRAPWQHFLQLPSPTLRCHEVEQIDCSLPQSHLSPASNLSIWKEFHVAVKERAINHHGFVLVHTSHTRLDPSEDLQSSQEDTWQSEGVGKIWTKTLQYLAHNSLTAFRPTAITSEEFLSVTKLLMIALRTGSRQSGGTISWAACAENKSNLMNSHWWRARSLQYFNFRF